MLLFRLIYDFTIYCIHMTSVKRFLFFCLLVPIFFKCSCHKEVYPSYYMDQEFKDYCVFPIGSYWIYQDSASNAIDSIYINRSEINFKKASSKLGYNYEELSVGTKRSYFNDSTFQFGQPGGAEHELYLLDETYFSSVVSSYARFFSKKDTGYVLNSSGGSILKYEARFDSIIINNKKYYEVKIFENIVPSGFQTDGERKLFYSKKIGIIRKELVNGQVWNLLRYHIN
jgi:hypothetical protein